MAEFNQGDVITFHLRGEKFGVATVAVVEDLALHDNVHLVIHDAVIEGTPGDDTFFEEDRHHASEDIDTSVTVVDHIGLTSSALAESDPVKVGSREITEDDLFGYQVWLALMRKAAAEQGLLRSRHDDAAAGDEPDEEEYDEEIVDEGEDDEVIDNADDIVEEGAGEEEGDGEIGDEYDDEVEDDFDDGSEEEISDEEILQEIEVQPWHRRLFDRPLGAALFEMHEAFAGEALRATKLGSYIASFYDGSKTEEIAALVVRLVDGDYSATTELLEFGDPAVGQLSGALEAADSVELVADILQLLGDMGTESAYRTIADYFARHTDLERDPLAIPAARAFAYVVMLTGGSAEALAGGIDRLSAISHPELDVDVDNAMRAVKEYAEAHPASGSPADDDGSQSDTMADDVMGAVLRPREISNDPFGGL
jgi:hypothetical protein